MLNLNKYCVENSIKVKMFLLRNENQCADTTLNAHHAARTYSCIIASNCTGERSFSRLKRIKNEVRNSMRQHRASVLSRTSIKYDILRSLDFKHFVNDFAIRKARKRFF